MEFLRFGSTIPGSYWGCCAVDIIQNFKVEPDAKASIQLVSGDGGNPVMVDGNIAFAGPTYRDIFNQRIRFGTFDKRDMPNHAFIAVITEDQIRGSIGKKWLQILREAGFEFIRSVSNSVYTGAGLGQPSGKGSSLNHIFGLFRNIGNGAPADPFTPPAAWTAMEKVTTEVWESINDPQALAKKQHAEQTAVWNKNVPRPLMTEDEVVAADAPVILAGLRSKFNQQTKEQRELLQQTLEKIKEKSAPDPFASVEVPIAEEVYGYDGEYDEDEDEDNGEYAEDSQCGDPDCEICLSVSY